MSGSETGSGMASGETVTTSGSLSHLPWSMIPQFDPGVTEINEYTKKVEFLASLWPEEHLHLLAPRIAMNCKGSAFQRVMRISPEKLKAQWLQGVKSVITALGGVWGKALHENKFEKFERAIFSTQQKPDETHESYLARHDHHFEEMLSMGTKLEEVRSYCLLRNSGLTQEDKKRIIIDSNGQLEHEKVLSAMKLLGSRFFQEVQGAVKSTQRSKTYDINTVTDEDPGQVHPEEDQVFAGEAWDDSDFYDESDPDAVICFQFEESLVDALQTDGEIAACYNTYLDARKRLTDKNKNRGFWNSSGNKGYSSFKGRGKSKSKFGGRMRKPLAQRILESECRRCGQRDHWKAECPLAKPASANAALGTTKEPSAFAGTTMTVTSFDADDDMILKDEMSEVPHCRNQYTNHPKVAEVFMCQGQTRSGLPEMSSHVLSKPLMSRFLQSLKARLSPQPVKHECPIRAMPDESNVDCLFVSHGPFGIVDLGASQTVIGSHQVSDLLQQLPPKIRDAVRKVPCRTVFRFGNSSTVQSDHAILVPLQQWYVRICVVPSQTPFLISNNVFRTLGAKIDTAHDTVEFSQLGFQMPLELSEKRLYLLDFCALVKRSTEASECTTVDRPIMHTITKEDFQNAITTAVPDPAQSCESKRILNSSSDDDRSVPESHHVDVQGQCQQPCRPSAGCDPDPSQRGSHEDVVRSVVATPNHIRRHQVESEIHRRLGDRPEVRPVVCKEVCWKSETSPSDLPSLHGVVCGATGTVTRESTRSRLQEQGQEAGEASLRSGQPSKLVGGRTGVIMGRDAGRHLSPAARRDRNAEPSHHEHGEHTDADRSATPAFDPVQSTVKTGENDALASLNKHCEDLRSWLYDEIGLQHVMDQSQDVHDPEYFIHNLTSEVPFDNWVHEEMWTYFHKSHPNMTEHEIHGYFKKSKIQILEVYCSENSQLTHQGSLIGMTTARFGLRQGDLSTFKGRCALYDMLWSLRPQHIWVSPKCGPWSSWNRLNAQKSLKLAEQIRLDKVSENVHLLMCDALFRLQDWRSDHCHFHLEQPQGSEMIWQKEMGNILRHTFRVSCDMCVAGQLRHPNSQEFLHKRTQVFSTSRIMWRMLQRCQCVGAHHHDVIAGSCRPAKMHRMPLTQYTELYTAMFGRRLSRAIQCSLRVSEASVGSRDEFLLTTNLEDDDTLHPEPKRRRLNGKSSPDQIDVQTMDLPSEEPIPESTHRERLIHLLHMAEQCTPRVGKVVLTEGPLFQAVQETFPEKQLVALDLCRGINRLRTYNSGSKGVAPYRRAFGKRRTDLEVFEDSEWEAWEVLSNRQQIRSGTPSRLLVTMFATQKRGPENPAEGIAKTARTISQVPSNPEDLNDKSSTTPVPCTAESNPIITPMTSESTTITHGPKFLKLDASTQNQIRKIHQNLGHPDNRVLQLALKRYGWPIESVQGCAEFQCPVCAESQKPKIARPGHLKDPKDFNDQVSFDGAEWQSPEGRKFPFYHFIDTATNYHIAVPYFQRTTEGLIEAFSHAWLRWAGPPKSLLFDSATEANSTEFARFLQEHSIESFVIPTEAHWQLGRAERHGATLKHMIDRYHQEFPISTQGEFDKCLLQLCNAKKSMSRHEGYTPELWVLGKMKPIPGSNCSTDLDSASYAGLDVQTPEGQRFQEQLARREAARMAFIKADHSLALRRALHARSRPNRNTFQTGELVMYWRSGKGVEEGSWHGPARVLMTEGANLVWISHLTRLYRCAPEHVRHLSQDEDASITPEEKNQSLQLPAKCGNGVFQFQELTNQSHSNIIRSHNNSDNVSNNTDQVTLNPPQRDTNPTTETPTPSITQPDDEPEIPMSAEAPVEPHSSEDSGTADPAVTVPVPDDTDDDLVTSHCEFDTWEVNQNQLIRHHANPRIQMFNPFSTWGCPVDFQDIGDRRVTVGTYASGADFQRDESWRNNLHAMLPQPEPWTGKTIFELNISSEQVHLSTTQTEKPDPKTKKDTTVTYAEIFLTLDDFQKCLGKTYDYQEAYLASQAKRQKIEVKTRDLNQSDRELFDKAKNKELDSWLATDTVKRILRSRIPEGQLLRSRWVLTWKPLDEIEQKETGMDRKAKARLVILGYEDPMIDSLPRDSPTLGRDSRMLALQCIASHRWTARSFDIKTAFLRGSRQDSRILGVEPPPELRLKMKLQDNEVCELLKGAYGLVNAPLLWYVELKNALLALGFVISPLDPCLFVLPKRKEDNDGIKIHGIVGIHVDDGIGGGDKVFNNTIQALERKYPFGSQRQGFFFRPQKLLGTIEYHPNIHIIE